MMATPPCFKLPPKQRQNRFFFFNQNTSSQLSNSETWRSPTTTTSQSKMGAAHVNSNETVEPVICAATAVCLCTLQRCVQRQHPTSEVTGTQHSITPITQRPALLTSVGLQMSAASILTRCSSSLRVFRDLNFHQTPFLSFTENSLCLMQYPENGMN